VELAEIVIDKCEKTFLSRLASARRRAYRQERGACARKYANKQGTMYVSFQATCEANVALKNPR
jgi:hypothetical protein